MAPAAPSSVTGVVADLAAHHHHGGGGRVDLHLIVGPDIAGFG
eukprot:CAMPEP_0181139544 /NCGR_PEP_ID=MMETSP1071-20121207/34837_1 /TAXON_ID=35127 /ORGANISM="Thalassiosira sp., Strain NH16" /LENGTH=42 /DNA_ID= /DNA_START= /DNA_END= /DNA_ORIENTATION=